MTKIRVRPKLSVAADCGVVVELNGIRARVVPTVAAYAAEFARGVASRPDYVDQDCSLHVEGGGGSSLELECVRAPDNPPIWRRNTALRMTVGSAGSEVSTTVTQAELGFLALALERAALLAATVESEVSR